MAVARPLVATGIVVLIVVWLSNAYAVAPPEKAKEKEKVASQKPATETPKVDESLKAFMRAKLGASTKILEGLALEDLDLVREGATELNRISSADKWRRHDDVLYRQFSAEFRQTTSDLIDAAKGNLFDRAALKWMDATMNCIECHRYVRNKLVADKK